MVHIAKLKLKAQKIGISRIEAGPAGGSIEFSEDTKVDPMFIISLIQSQPSVFKMEGANKLKFIRATDDAKSRFTLITSILGDLNKKLN